MAYATTTDLARLGIGADALEEIETGAKTDALDAASSLVDSYLGGVFTLPLTAWGDDLKRATAAIAAYDILVVRGLDPTTQAHELLRARYDDAIRWLEKVAAGLVTPVVTDSSTTTRPSAPRVHSNTARGW